MVVERERERKGEKKREGRVGAAAAAEAVRPSVRPFVRVHAGEGGRACLLSSLPAPPSLPFSYNSSESESAEREKGR